MFPAELSGAELRITQLYVRKYTMRCLLQTSTSNPYSRGTSQQTVPCSSTNGTDLCGPTFQLRTGYTTILHSDFTDQRTIFNFYFFGFESTQLIVRQAASETSMFFAKSRYTEGMVTEEIRKKQILFLVLSPWPGPDGPNASGWYRRLREPISPLSLLNCDQI